MSNVGKTFLEFFGTRNWHMYVLWSDQTYGEFPLLINVTFDFKIYVTVKEKNRGGGHLKEKTLMHFDIFHMKCTVVASGQTIYCCICIVAQCALTRQLFQVQTIKSGLLSHHKTQWSNSFLKTHLSFYKIW